MGKSREEYFNEVLNRIGMSDEELNQYLINEYIVNNVRRSDVQKNLNVTNHFIKLAIHKYNIRKDPKKISENAKENETEEKKQERMNKMFDTIEKKYGKRYPTQNKEIKDKVENTKLKRYGNKHFMNTEKAQQTKLERYGSRTYNNREQAKKTIEERYGNSILGNKEIREKCSNTLYAHYGVRHNFQIPEVRKSITSKFRNKLKDKDYKENFTRKVSKLERKNTVIENQIIDYILNINKNITIIQNDKTVIKNPSTNRWLELDIYIPDYNLAIEYNSLHWHNKDNPIRENLKTQLCKQQNIRLIHVWEDDWFNENSNIREVIKKCLE